MDYPKSKKYDIPLINEKMMGPNPVKLEEELLRGCPVAPGSLVMDLGSGQGVTSVFLAKEYGVRVVAADLWSDPGENLAFFRQMGLTEQDILPLRADANDLPFARGCFDGVVCTDSYNYFGRDPAYLGEKLLPFVKPGGWFAFAVTGMRRDLHGALPPELLLSWTPEQLDYIRDADYWRATVAATAGIEGLEVAEMESNEEIWADWLACDNDYARGDRRSMEAGAGQYLNFISIKFRRSK